MAAEPATAAPASQPQTSAPAPALIETAALDTPQPAQPAPAATSPAATATSAPAKTAPAKPAADLDSKADCKAEFADALSSATIVFASDSAVIDKQSRGLLDKLAAIAKRCSRFSLVVEGHTDGTGRKGHNDALSRKRAEAVRWALVDRGIDMDHISAIGYGASRPLEPGTGASAVARNRRIEFSVLEPTTLRPKAALEAAKK
jgi:outer membrane protein OmpA-like peptidoglycan-associated protein